MFFSDVRDAFVDSEAPQQLSTYNAVLNAVSLASADVMQKPTNRTSATSTSARDSATSTVVLRDSLYVSYESIAAAAFLEKLKRSVVRGRLLEGTSQLFQLSSDGID